MKIKRLILLFVIIIIVIITIFSISYIDRDTIYVYDLKRFIDEQKNPKVAYDYLKLAASIQGLANRDKPSLYFNFETNFLAKDLNLDIDKFWFNELKKDGQLLSNYKIVELESFDDVLGQFKEVVKGIVLWDEKVPATSNVATTICGVEQLLPIRYDKSMGSVYKTIVEEKKIFSVKKNLVNKFNGKGKVYGTSIKSTLSAKNDAYIWAKINYLDKGKTNRKILAYSLDAYATCFDVNLLKGLDLFNSGLVNQDYYISKKAFFFDLSPDRRGVINDDPEQVDGTDVNTFEKILLSQSSQAGNQITTIGGFVPWFIKYSSIVSKGALDPVTLEWAFIDLVSKYNTQADPDAYSLIGMANASVFCHEKLMDNFAQKNNKGDKTKTINDNKKYIVFQIGDFGAGAWMSSVLPTIWNDPIRGKMPLSWSFSTNLSERVPQVFNYIYNTMTKNDYFVAGENGAGYLNARMLSKSYRPYGLKDFIGVWEKYNKKMYMKFDLSITGMLISGSSLKTHYDIQEAYSRISPDGVANNAAFTEPIVNGTLFTSIVDLTQDPRDSKQLGENLALKLKNGPQFQYFRCVITKPNMLYEAVNHVRKNYPEVEFEVIDPYTYFRLYKTIWEKFQ